MFTTYKTHEFIFSVQEVSTDLWVELKFQQFDPETVSYLKKIWFRLSQAYGKACQYQKKNPPDWVAWQPHNWAKEKHSNRISIAAWANNTLAGFVNLRTEHCSPVDEKVVVYLEHIAAFPGNMDSSIWNKRMKRVGGNLFAFALLQAKRWTHSARLGLHVVDESQGFYERLDSMKPGIFASNLEGVEGYQESCRSLKYIETNDDIAWSFVLDHLNE